MMKGTGKIIFLSAMVFLAAFYMKKGFSAQSPANISGNISVDTNVPDQNGSSVVLSPQSGNLNFFRLKSTLPPEVSSTEALIEDLETGEIYFGKNQDMRWPMASITKLMTATIAKEELNPGDIITFAEPDFADADSRFTAFFYPGAQFHMQEIMQAMLVGSVNECAEALARTAGYDRFMAAMNRKAVEWGLTQTYFQDPDGISAANQSSASDLFIIASHIYKENPDIFNITRNTQIAVTDASSTKHAVQSVNDLAGRSDFLGGKTGTTAEAGQNLLSIISYGGHPVVVIVLGSDDRYKDANQLIQWFENDFSPGY